MVVKIIFCFEFLDIPDNAGRKTRRRRKTQAIAKRCAFHAIIWSNYIRILIYFEINLVENEFQQGTTQYYKFELVCIYIVTENVCLSSIKKLKGKWK